MAKPPFEEFYAVRVGKVKKIYNKLSVAKAYVTRSLDNSRSLEAKFSQDVELWSVGTDGWILEFSAKAGDSHEAIPWDNAVKGNAVSAARWAEYHRKLKEDRDRAAYEKLKAQFGE